MQRRYHEQNIPVYTEFLLGLPGETYNSFLRGIDQAIEAGLHDQLNIFFCQALPNSEMTDPAYVKQHGIRTQRVELTEFHATRRKPREVVEFEEIVVATNTMTISDWKRAATYAWLIQILHGLKLGFFVLAFLNQRYKVKYSEFCNYLLAEIDRHDRYCAMTAGLRDQQAYLEDLLSGGRQCVFLDDYGDISWSMDEAGYLKFSEHLELFYAELKILAEGFLKQRGINYDPDLLYQVFVYQQARVPNYRSPVANEFEFCFNVPQYFDCFLRDEAIEIMKLPQRLILKNVKDFKNNKAEFAKQVVWFGRKDKGIIHQAEWEACQFTHSSCDQRR